MSKETVKFHDVLSRMARAEKYFTGQDFVGTLRIAKSLWNEKKIEECSKVLDCLPTPENLLDKLVEKLKGKSVYKTIKQIRDGKTGDPAVQATGLSFC